jgi:hypothetical protein
MKKFLQLITLFFITQFAFAQGSDTITVQTFTNGSPQDAWFVFPSDTVRLEKILMQYKLKCNPAQNPACGEWDYLTYTYLYKNTGLLDSSAVNQPTFLVNGNVQNSVSFIQSPSYSYNTHWQYQTVNTNTISLTTAQVGNGNTSSNHPLGSSQPVSRAIYLWRASELIAAGLSAGNITGLQLNLSALGSELKNFKIRLKAVASDTLTSMNFNNTGFTTVYNRNTQFQTTGWNTIQFTSPFNWNGTSNIIVEFLYDNIQAGVDNVVNSTASAFKSGLVNSGADRCISMHQHGFVDVPLNSQLAAIDSFVTISFWAYGTPQFQPSNGTCFEAVDANGNRVLNSHTPWSDSKVYWDAGNQSGYDRAQRILQTSQMEGQWNHWAFTKNVFTQSMRMTLNGVQLQNAPGKSKRMLNINKFRIGKGNWNGSSSYEGKMDQFMVFNTDLSLENIQKLYRKKIDASHPNYNNLVMNFNFDDGNYISAQDASPNLHPNAILNDGIDNPLKSSTDLVTNFTETTLRPNIIFEQGVYTSYRDSSLVVDSLMNAPTQIITFTDSINNPGKPVDTLMVWLPYYRYTFNNQGNIIDSVLIGAQSTMNLSYYTWYRKFPQVLRYELGRYITPYGNGLSLGDGWTWTFDVSDYRTLLKDSVHLAAGNWQELLDLKFQLIKGTPPRDVLGIQNLWTGQFNYGHTNDPIESHLTPITVNIPNNAQTSRWKSRVTGHGMDTPQNCAEFCPKTHYYKVNGTQRFSKLIWRDNCDVNPLFPQGGTWVYDRANWCPGAEVWTYDFELTPYVSPGNSAILDHDVQAYTNNGEWSFYQIEDQLVHYGAPNFTVDAAIEEIIAPSQHQMWQRKNPVCNQPIIRIKNTGSQNLTSLTITYGLTGATPSVFQWTGNLAFTQSAEVYLNGFDRSVNSNEFYVTVSNPNNTADTYTNNNTMKSVFTAPPLLPSKLIIELKTNVAPYENYYVLKNSAGNVVHERNALTANTTYSDTLLLNNDCYVFELTDTGEDGLSWWANTAQGSGTIKIKNGNIGSVIKTYNPDFGGQVYQQFSVDSNQIGIQDYLLSSFSQLITYPNPSDGKLTVAFNLMKRLSNVKIEIKDLLGRKIAEKDFETALSENLEFDLKDQKPGVYFISLITEEGTETSKVILNR